MKLYNLTGGDLRSVWPDGDGISPDWDVKFKPTDIDPTA